LKYRAEIDGLRALAVIPVILFHAGFELFSGGFVGVDVFFVISGYLITTILIEDIESNRFSIVNFYERRARRILPALFFVMLVCIPFAWMWMVPNQFKDFSQSLVAVSLFASNILFWRESGYFGGAAEEKPLLHTWSLAVEEQYYFLFPIFLILTWRFGKNKVFWVIVFFSAVSLLLSEWGWRNKATANFFLFPTRAWELLAGSLAAFIIQKNGVKKNETLSFLGLAAIIFSIFYYSEATPFPSVYALVPVIGVVLLILYADKETLVAKLLSTKAFVSIGLISYSAYLWHQPLFAFTKIIYGVELDSKVTLILIIGTLFLAILSWKYIETPFRDKKKVCSRTVFKLSIPMLLIPLSFGATLMIKDINYNRQLPNGNSFSDYGFIDAPHEKIGYAKCEGFQVTGACGHNEDTNAIAWGDSYVKHGIPFVEAYEKLNVGQVALSSCTPFIGHMETPTLKRNSNIIRECQSFNAEVVRYIANNNSIKNVVIGSRFSLIELKKDSEIIDLAHKFYREFESFIEIVDRPINVILFPPPPTPSFDPSKCINSSLMRGLNPLKCDYKADEISELYAQQKLFITTVNDLGIASYPLEDIMCPKGICKTIIGTLRIYRDNGHIRNQASKYFGTVLAAAESHTN
jgi:peptidoglycan/LPS O-acetylase OafA/YrhL